MVDDSGCPHTIPSVQTTFDWTGCNNCSCDEDDFKAVPNPANNHVNITLTGVSDEMILSQPEIVLFDISGKVVYQSEIALNEIQTIDLSSFNSGVYFIKIVDDNTLLSTGKLIIE